MCEILHDLFDVLLTVHLSIFIVLLTVHLSIFIVLLTVHLSIFIAVINRLDAQNFCFTLSLFHTSTYFEHMCSKRVLSSVLLLADAHLIQRSSSITIS